MHKTIAITSFSLMLYACATTATTATTPTADVAAHAIEHAVAAQQKAAEVGNEWRDTDEMISDAKKAVEAKEFARAIELALQAERQGHAAVKQYKSQQNVASNY